MSYEYLATTDFEQLIHIHDNPGARNTDTDARRIIKGLGIPEAEIPQIRRLLLRGVQAPLYEGVSDFVGAALQNGHSITIWTEGETVGDTSRGIPGALAQHQKVAGSGIMDTVRSSLPDRNNRKSQFRVASVEEGKAHVLGDILREYEQKGIKTVILADDKAKTIDKAAKEIQRIKDEGIFTGTVQLVWVQQGRHALSVPEGYASVEEFSQKFKTVPSFSAFAEQVQPLIQSDAPVGFLIDWDHTLSNTTEFYNGQRDVINHRIATVYLPKNELQSVPYLAQDSPEFTEIYSLLGFEDKNIPKDRVLIHSLGGGMSFVNVLRVNWDGANYVMKFENNPDRMWRMEQEIEGYTLLDAHAPAFRHYLPHIEQIGTDPVLGSYILMEYFNGPNLREAMKKKLLPDDAVCGSVHKILDFEYDFYASQAAQIPDTTPDTWFSMPKEEWQDTDTLIGKLGKDLACDLSISEEELLSLPIRVEVNGEVLSLPSLSTIHESMRRIVTTPPPVVLPILFNDLSQGNIVAVPRPDGSIDNKIVDPQWVRRFSNPRADIVRPIKSVSVTTATGINGSVAIDNGQLVFNSDACVPELFYQIEEEAIGRLPKFGELIGDPDFTKGVLQELAASQWREVALIARGRGTPAQIGFNLWNMHRYLSS